jgi:probable HAF family extracellular repeat protein
MFHRCVTNLFILSLLMSFVVGNVLGAVQYAVTDLGTFSGGWGDQSGACDINNSGQIVGYSDAANGNREAFLYRDGAMVDLNSFMPDTGPFSCASAINSSGQVVGYMRGAWGGQLWGDRAFLYSGGVVTALGSIPGDSIASYACDINDNGQVVGYADDGGMYRGFLYADGTLTALPTSTNYVGSLARAVSNDGKIVGNLQTKYGSSAGHAFIYDISTQSMTDLGTISGGTTSVATAINDSGRVVGIAGTANTGFYSGYHAFTYCDGTMTDLGVPDGYSASYAYGINASGEIVGYLNQIIDSAAYFYGFVYKDGKMTNLNDLIDPASGWTILEADAINDDGMIVGYGYNPNVWGDHALLLTPIPEPPSFIFLGISAIGVLGYAWQRRK